MAELLFPINLVTAAARWDLVSNASFFRSLSGAIRTYSRTGDYWRASLTLPVGKEPQASYMRALATQLRGGIHSLWVWDHSYTQRGSFPASELLANTTFASTTSWTAYNGASTLSAAENVLRVTAGSTNQYIGAYQNITVTSGVAYAGRAIIRSGDVSTMTTCGVNLWDTAGAASIVQSYTAGFGLKQAGALAPSTGLRLEIVTTSSGTHAVGDLVNIDFASISRCMLVMGASQTGNVLDVDALPNSTNGLLLPGDRVQIGTQVVVVTEPLNSNGSGQGRLQFEPPLRSSPADNSPVIVHQPMCRMIPANAEAGWDVRPGPVTSMALDLIEDLR